MPLDGTPSTQLLVAIPGGATAAKTVYASCLLLDNSARTTGYLNVNASGTTIGINRTDAATFSAATDATYVFGSITFEIA